MQASGRTRIQLCGRLVVELDGRRIEDALPSRQGRLLFAYLALNSGRAVRRDELIDRLWPERPPADPAAALNTIVSRLRRALGASVIAGRAELELSLPADAEIDVRVAADALARAQAAVAEQDWQAAWGPARAALAIAERGLLVGLDAPWIDERRRELEDLELQALEAVAETGLGLGGGELAAAERGATKLIARAPLRESGHGLRMRLLAARGNMAEALQAFDALRQLLREELGTTPSPELLALHRGLLDGEVPAATGSVDGQRPSTAAVAPVGTGDFVGRDRELELLERALSDARAGQLRLVLIGGEAGIGKTRLAEELAARAAAAAAAVTWGRCYEGYGAPAFWPWVEIVRRLSEQTTPQQLRRALGAGAGDLARIVPELYELLPDLDGPPLLDPEAARFRLYDSIARFLVRLAARQPLVLVLDDLQWADTPSLELIRFLAARGEAPILIVGTYRSTEVDDSPALADALAALTEEPGVSRLELSGLAQDELAELVERTTAADVGTAVAASVHHRTGGNPFYASQLVRLLEGEGALDSRAAEQILRQALPGGVRDVIRRRLEKLPEGTTELLRRAAVVGEEFELELVARLAAVNDEEALNLFENALRQHIISDSPTAVGRFRFCHALVRETLYTELPAVRRSRLHGEVAVALEEMHGDHGEGVFELAHHLSEAASLEGADKALTYAVRAADLAMARLAYEQAEHQLRRAFELLQRIPAGGERAERELDLQLRIGALLMMTKGYADPEVGAACARARVLCREVGNQPQLLSALWRLGAFYEVRAELAKAQEIGEQLLVLGGSDGAPFQLAGRQMLGVAALHGGEPLSAQGHLLADQALADELGGLADVFGMDFRVTSRAFLGWASSLLEDDRGTALSAEALGLARMFRNPHDEAFALYLDALCAVIRRDVRIAALRAEEGVELCSARGFRLFGAMTRIVGGWALAEQGEPVRGVGAIEEGLTAFEATGARMMLHLFYALLAEALSRAGRLAEALAAVEDGLSRVGSTNRFYEAELHRLNGELLLALGPGRAAEAKASLEQAVSVARDQQARTLELRAETSLRRLVPA